MHELLYMLQQIKPKHDLEYEIEYGDHYSNGTIHVCFTVYRDDNWNNSIYIYNNDKASVRIKKIKRIKKLLSHKRKALKFIGAR